MSEFFRRDEAIAPWVFAISLAVLFNPKNVFREAVPNLAKSIVSFAMIAPNIAKPGPLSTFPIPLTIPRAKSLPSPSPSRRSLMFETRLLKNPRMFFKLSVTPISPRVFANSFKFTVASLIAADNVLFKVTLRV